MKALRSFFTSNEPAPTQDAVQTAVPTDSIYVDVRSEIEVRNSHVEGCLWVSLDKLLQNPQAALDYIQSKAPDKKIKFYCRSGSRSHFATEVIKQLGADAENAGGLYALTQKQIPTATGLPTSCN